MQWFTGDRLTFAVSVAVKLKYQMEHSSVQTSACKMVAARYLSATDSSLEFEL
jgi:hypothetical protein